jgi:hypothetical protein
MIFKLYKIVENIPKSDFSHIKLSLVDLVSKEVLQNNIKLKIGIALEDDSNNIFRVNGYFGDYMVLRPSKVHCHPSGEYLICKKA